jgi:hypothetical protein
MHCPLSLVCLLYLWKEGGSLVTVSQQQPLILIFCIEWDIRYHILFLANLNYVLCQAVWICLHSHRVPAYHTEKQGCEWQCACTAMSTSQLRYLSDQQFSLCSSHACAFSSHLQPLAPLHWLGSSCLYKASPGWILKVEEKIHTPSYFDLQRSQNDLWTLLSSESSCPSIFFPFLLVYITCTKGLVSLWYFYTCI